MQDYRYRSDHFLYRFWDIFLDVKNNFLAELWIRIHFWRIRIQLFFSTRIRIQLYSIKLQCDLNLAKNRLWRVCRDWPPSLPPISTNNWVSAPILIEFVFKLYIITIIHNFCKQNSVFFLKFFSRESGSALRMRIRIRIQEGNCMWIHAEPDPDPQP